MNPQIPLSVSQNEIESFNRFRLLLSETDRQVLDDLLQSASHNQAAIQYSGYDLPFHTFLISLLIEQHKDLARLRRLVEETFEKK